MDEWFYYGLGYNDAVVDYSSALVTPMSHYNENWTAEQKADYDKGYEDYVDFMNLQ